MSRFTSIVSAIVVLVAFSTCAFGQAVTYEGQSLLPIGNPGNTGTAPVAYSYYAGQYDVTVDQYAAFLNAVVPYTTTPDTYGLIPTNNVGTPGVPEITKSGAGTVASPYTYAPSTGTYQSTPYNYSGLPIYGITWAMSVRYINWLDNGTPSGLGEVTGSTETGAYNLTTANGIGTDAAYLAVANPNHTTFTGFVLPTQQEWYKAAFYNPTTSLYNTYTTGSNTAPTISATESATGPTITAIGANGFYGVTPVTTHYLSLSSYGLYDAGGNGWQYNEYNGTSYADFEGGSNGNSGYYSGGIGYPGTSYPNYKGRYTADSAGFRVYYMGTIATIPEPGTLVLLAAGLFGLLCYAWRKRR